MVCAAASSAPLVKSFLAKSLQAKSLLAKSPGGKGLAPRLISVCSSYVPMQLH